MNTFGSSAPLKDLLTKFGFTPAKVLAAAKEQIAKSKGTARSMNVQLKTKAVRESAQALA